MKGTLKAGETISLFSALALFVVMFVGWYGADVAGQAREISLGGGSGGGGNAWQALEGVSLVLLLTVVVAFAAALLRLLGSKWSPAIPPSASVAVLGGLSTLLILLRILFPPDFGELGGVPLDATLELGAFLGLAAAAGIAYGGYRAMGENETSFLKISETLSRHGSPAKRKRPRGSEKPASRRRSPSSSD